MNECASGWAPGLTPVTSVPAPFSAPSLYSQFTLRSTTLYSLSKPDDALGGRNASLVCNLSHAYHFYDCAPPPRLPSYAGSPRAPGTTRSYRRCAPTGDGILHATLLTVFTYLLNLFLRGDRLDRFTHENRSPTYHAQQPLHLCSLLLPCISHLATLRPLPSFVTAAPTP